MRLSARCACVYDTRMNSKSLNVMLDPKHKLFADQYLLTGRISESARHAGYSGRSAHVSGNRLLKRPDVIAYLAQQAAKVTEQQEDLQSKVVRELTDMAFANIGDFITIDDEGIPQVDFTDATPEQLKAIASITSKTKTTHDKEGGVTVERDNRFAFADKYRGLELLGKHLGLFKADEQRVVVDVADRLLAARARLRQSQSDGGLGNSEEGGGGAGV